MRNLIRMSAVMLALFCTVTVMAGGQHLSSQVSESPSVHTGILPVCGDGVAELDAGETCDPPGVGAAPNGNDCREDCTYCGDGLPHEGEECDDGNDIDTDDCSNDCTVVVLPDCGDGYPDPALGETCDPPGIGAAPNGNDCRADCTYCGDGYPDFGEECDDGNTDDFDDCSNDCISRPGGEGCTPGYWKNKHFAWDDGPPLEPPYTPGTFVGDVFTLGGFVELGGFTLNEALRWNSGGDPEEEALNKARNLIKHAIASLLNATHPDVAFSWMAGDIIDAVNDALDDGDPEYMDDLHLVFDNANNADCPLSGRPPRTATGMSRENVDTSHTKTTVGGRPESRPSQLQRN